MFKLSEEGFSFHTFQLNKMITSDELDALIKKEYSYAKIYKYRVFKDDRVLISNRFASKGIRIRYCKNPVGKPPHIEIIVNPRIVLGDYNYAGVFINTEDNRENMIKALDDMLYSIYETLSFNSMTLARIDLCANIEFDNQSEMELYMKLIRKCCIPNGYKREKFKPDQTDYRIKNKNSLRATRNLDMFTIYNKTAQMRQEGIGIVEKNILRFELCLYRKGIYSLIKKEFGSVEIPNDELIRFLADSSKKLIMSRIEDFISTGIYLKYDIAEKVIENNDSISSKMKERMLFLLRKTSDLSNLNKSMIAMKQKFDLNDRQVEAVLLAFENNYINPVTIPNRNLEAARVSVAEIFDYKEEVFYHMCKSVFSKIGQSVSI